PSRARRASDRLGAWAATVARRAPWWRGAAFALVGAVVAVLLLGRAPAKVGPFETTMALRPSLSGETVVHLAPLGTIQLDTHDWPVRLDLRVDEIGVADAERIAADPARIETLGDDAAAEVRSALLLLGLRSGALAVAGGVAGALAAGVPWSWRSVLGGGAVGSLLVVALGTGSLATFRADAVAEPRYTGLLTRAPTAVGDIEAVIDRFGEYREQLSELVDNVATLYLAGEELPTFEPDDRLVRVLHVSDVHLNPQAFDMMDRLTEQFGVDVVADTGDLTDWGTDPEARLLGRIGRLDVPYVYVRGNHDSAATQRAVAAQPNAVVLDGRSAEVAGLRFWGVGDPRYTPDKSQRGPGGEGERAAAAAPGVAEALRADEPPPVDVAMVHDPRMASDLGGVVPLVLAGHTHEPDERTLPPADTGTDGDGDGDEGDGGDRGDEGDEGEGTGPPGAGGGTGEGTVPSPTTAPDGEGTRLLVEGSTGGAGLRGLQGEEPEPLTASILYLDPTTRRLVAYDRLTVAWLRDTGATIERHVVVDRDDTAGAGRADR
ncbi:MAG TPA: metallophosphoesterase, partial [Acidimicrobiales bacterium]|nr:metallophosphoesterase [Acidimicrobiales bacterium]